MFQCARDSPHLNLTWNVIVLDRLRDTLPYAPLTNLSFSAQFRYYTNLFIDVELISSSIYRCRANYLFVLSFTIVDNNSLNLTAYFQSKWCFWVFLQYIFPSKACYAGNGLDFLGNLYMVGRQSTGCPAMCITSGLWYRYACWFSHAGNHVPAIRALAAAQAGKNVSCQSRHPK